MRRSKRKKAKATVRNATKTTTIATAARRSQTSTSILVSTAATKNATRSAFTTTTISTAAAAAAATATATATTTAIWRRWYYQIHKVVFRDHLIRRYERLVSNGYFKPNLPVRQGNNRPFIQLAVLIRLKTCFSKPSSNTPATTTR